MAEKHSKAALVHSSSVRELSPNALRQLLYVINFSLMHLEGLAMSHSPELRKYSLKLFSAGLNSFTNPS